MVVEIDDNRLLRKSVGTSQLGLQLAGGDRRETLVDQKIHLLDELRQMRLAGNQSLSRFALTHGHTVREDLMVNNGGNVRHVGRT